MTQLRLLLLAALAILAISAVEASASAAFTEFTAAEGAKVHYIQKGNQVTEYRSGKATVGEICTGVSGSFTVKGKKTELEGSPAWGKSCTVGGLNAEEFNSCAWDVHIGGSVDLNGTQCRKTEVISTKCKIKWKGAQTGLKSVSYENKENDLVATVKLAGISFESATGKACGFETEAVVGTASYNGAILIETTNVK